MADGTNAWAAEVTRLRTEVAADRMTRDEAVDALLAFTAANGIAITRSAAGTLIDGAVQEGPGR